jgi:hypothetical protein
MIDSTPSFAALQSSHKVGHTAHCPTDRFAVVTPREEECHDRLLASRQTGSNAQEREVAVADLDRPIQPDVDPAEY